MKQIGTAVLIYAQENDEFLPRSSHSAAVFRTLRWGQAIMPYLGRGKYKIGVTDFNDLLNGLYRCPVDIRRWAAWSYGKNVWFELNSSETGSLMGISSGPTYWKLTQMRHQAQIVEFGEMMGAKMASASAADHVMAHFWLMGGEPEIDFNRHGNNTSNYLFLDGHVERLVFKMTFDPNTKIDNWNPGKYDWEKMTAKN
jgi:prepilin-type processing-associated H-X9-DG protein